MFGSQSIMYDYLMRLIGTPYRWGGDDAMDGFDCSGLAIEFLMASGQWAKGQDATASGLKEYFKAKGVIQTKASFGALVFFGNPISHVGIALNDTFMVEAGGGDSKTTSLDAAKVQNAFVRVRPINSRKDVNSIILPNYPWGVFQ